MENYLIRVWGLNDQRGCKKKGLAPVNDAKRLTFIRRVTFDLAGLPPTPEEIDVFVENGSADALEWNYHVDQPRLVVRDHRPPGVPPFH